MSSRKKKAGKSSKNRRRKAIEVDFTGVEAGGKSIPDGEIVRWKVEEVEEREGDESGEPYLNWKMKSVAPKKHAGVVMFETTSLQPQALWKLRGLLEALGVEVPDGAMEIEPSDYIGEEFTCKVVNEEYDGRDRPKIASYTEEDPDESDDDDDDDDDEDEGKKKKGKKDDEDEDDDDDKDDDDDDDDDDEDEDEDPKAKKRRERQAKRRADRKKKKDDDDDDSDDDNDEDEDEGKKSKKGKKGKEADHDFEVKQKVSFEEDGETYKGKIVEIDGNVATVDVKGEEWQVEVSDLEAL